jgi:hypothetical protein
LLAAAEARGKKKGTKTLEDAFEEIAELRAIIAVLVEKL